MPECTLHEQFSSGKSYRVNSKIKVLKGGVILIPKHCPRGNVWVLCRPSIDLKDKWRSFPKAFQNYTLRGFFLIRTRFAHFIHNCHDILRQFMIENMQL